jgi:hypothetical protein
MGDPPISSFLTGCRLLGLEMIYSIAIRRGTDKGSKCT